MDVGELVGGDVPGGLTELATVSKATGRRVRASKTAKQAMPPVERKRSVGDSSLKRAMATQKAIAMARDSRMRKMTKSL